MVELGRIVRLQIQTDLLVREGYDPAPLIEVDRLLLTPSGALAPRDGGWTIDSHHRDFPHRRHWSANRALSIGFTAHYRAMSDHFETTALGCAGENVMVEADQQVTLEDLAGGLAIEGERHRVELKGIQIAQPCVPFTRFMLGRDASGDEVEDHRDFLRDGMRGYVMGLEHLEEPVQIHVGDRVSLL